MITREDIARAIAVSLDNDYDDELEVFYSVRVEGPTLIIKVLDDAGDPYHFTARIHDQDPVIS